MKVTVFKAHGGIFGLQEKVGEGEYDAIFLNGDDEEFTLYDNTTGVCDIFKTAHNRFAIDNEDYYLGESKKDGVYVISDSIDYLVKNEKKVVRIYNKYGDMICKVYEKGAASDEEDY